VSPGTRAETEAHLIRHLARWPLLTKAPWTRSLRPFLAAGVPFNLNKFLVDPAGDVVAHLDSAVEPTSAEMKQRLEAILPKG